MQARWLGRPTAMRSYGGSRRVTNLSEWFKRRFERPSGGRGGAGSDSLYGWRIDSAGGSRSMGRPLRVSVRLVHRTSAPGPTFLKSDGLVADYPLSTCY